MGGMRRCGRYSSRLKPDIVSLTLREARVVHPKRLTSLRDEWRLIGVHHPCFLGRPDNFKASMVVKATETSAT